MSGYVYRPIFPIVQRQRERKGGTDTRRADCGEIAAQQTRELATDRQPQPCPTILPRRAVIRLLKFPKEATHCFGANADAGVGDGDDKVAG